MVPSALRALAASSCRWQRRGLRETNVPLSSLLSSRLACLLLLSTRIGSSRLPEAATGKAIAFNRHSSRGSSSATSTSNSDISGLLMGFAVRPLRMEGIRNSLSKGSRPPSVAVIGAGAAGLAAGRILKDEGMKVKIFESKGDVGGVWRYDESPEAGSPMYRSLVTNLPKESMSYFGMPFPEDLPSFNTHAQVLDYLSAYANYYSLLPLISFGCPVTSVRPISTAAGSENHQEDTGQENDALGIWEVVYRDGSLVGDRSPAAAASDDDDDDDDSGATVAEVFDAVCVCNGHYDTPFVPEVEGLEEFQGTSMHARAYDRPDMEAFLGRRVLCVGSRSSGTDIAREVSSVAAVVHVCDRGASASLKGGEQGNIWWRPALEKFEGSHGVRFKDGALEQVDTVVWCTGYSYSFPFLEGSGLLNPPITERVHPLYEQLFHVEHPSLTFIGLPQSVIPFPLFEIQANAVAAALAGRLKLPPQGEREQWLLQEEKTALLERGVEPASRRVNFLGTRQWPYEERLLRLAGGDGWIANAPGELHGTNRNDHFDQPGVGAREGEETDRGAAPVGKEGKPQEESGGGVLGMLKLREAIYNDASKSRPPFPGGPDDYRRRLYHVDWEKRSFSVSMAARKANGEGPSTVAAAATAAAAAAAVSHGGVPEGTTL